MLNTVMPFFIVDDLAKTLDFYRSRLGFTLTRAAATNPPKISGASSDEIR